LDNLIPARSVTCRRRPSDPWFDQDCRTAKRRVRALERIYRIELIRPTPPQSLLPPTRGDLNAAPTASCYNGSARSFGGRKWSLNVPVLDVCGSLSTHCSAVVAFLRPTALTLIHCTSFFVQKVDGVRTATADALPPTFVPVRDGCSIDAFSLVTVDVVIAAVNALPNKQCASDHFLLAA